ncbi:hypothetical protein BaRGS_00024741, partial [Batillaria attramentaria]
LTVQLVETVYGAGGYYGGVQVNRYGFWGPVCNNSWDDRDANATCHGLGYTYGITFYGRDRTGSPMLVGNFTCTGQESSLADCPFNDIDDDVGCSLAIGQYGRVDAGVLCYDTPGVELRLTGGGRNYGRLEVQYEGEWGRVADDHFSSSDATIACKQLGYLGGRGAPYNMRTSGQGRIWMSYVVCGGKERTLFECYNYWNNPRVSRGNSVSVGVVEVNINNKWGTVCDNQWTSVNTRVTCKDLGFDNGYHLCCNAFGNTVYPVMDQVQCTESETDLASCPHYVPRSRICDGSTVAVACYKGTAPTGYTYQLNGGPTNNTGEITVDFMNVTGRICSDGWDDTDAGIYYQLGSSDSGFKGRVEVEVDGQLGTVCRSDFDSREATVFCRSVGFNDGQVDYMSDPYPNPPDRIYQASFRCTGDEMQLEDCPHQGWRPATSRHCSHQRDANVICYNDVRIGGRYDPSIKQGPVQLYRNGKWYNLCDTDFDDVTARRVCGDLEFVDGKAVCCSAYGSWSWAYDTHLNYTMRCDGTETSASACIRDSNCVSGNYASVVCYNSTDYVVDSKFVFVVQQIINKV